MVVPLVVIPQKCREEIPSLPAFPREEPEYGLLVGLFLSKAIDARNAGNDYDIASFYQGFRRREPQFFYPFVYRSVFLDIKIVGRDISFRLVVVVIAYEIMNSVFRKEGLEFRVKLGGQCLVMRNDEDRSLDSRDRASYRKGLPASGHP